MSQSLLLVPKRQYLSWTSLRLNYLRVSTLHFIIDILFSSCPSLADSLLQENFEVPFDPNFPFGSEAANLEYNILSAILGNNNPSPSQGESTPPPTFSNWPSSDPLLSSQSSAFMSSSAPSSYLTYQYQDPPRTSELAELQYPQFQQSNGSVIHPVQPRYPLPKSPKSPLSVFIDESSHGLLSPPHSNASPSLTPSVPRPADSSSLVPVGTYTPGSKLQSINDRVTKPYDYTEGYHFLMKHLPIRCVYSFREPIHSRVST